MKTLNEVIEKCQENINLVDRGEWEGDCFLSHEYMIDILHYLKEYQEYKDQYNEAIKNCKKAEQDHYNIVMKNYILDNEPLTWYELQTMEGEPIWVEGSWEIVDGCYEEYFSTDTGAVYYRKNDECYGDYGKDWQAYRRETK